MDGTLQHADVLFAMEHQVNALIAGIKAACRLTADQVDRTLLNRQARQLLDFCQEESLLELVVLEGGVEAVVPMITLADTVYNSLSEVAKCACCILTAMALKPEYKRVILASQALPGILQLLSLHTEAVTPGVSRRAVEAITALVQGSRTLQELLRESGGVDSIVRLLGSSDVHTQRAAVVALRCLSTKNDTNKQHMVKCEALELLVKVLRGGDSSVQHKALQLLGDLAHSSKDIRQQALKAGAMLPLVRLLSCVDGVGVEGVRCAALLVGQFAAPPLEDGALAVGLGDVVSIESDVIPALIPLLSSHSTGVQEMAAFALARLAQLPAYQAAIIQHQGLPPLLKLLNSHSSSVQYNAAFTLYELSDSPQQASLLHQAGGLQHLYVCSQRLQKGQVKSCVDRTIMRVEQHHKAAASRTHTHLQLQLQQQQQQQQQHSSATLDTYHQADTTAAAARTAGADSGPQEGVHGQEGALGTAAAGVGVDDLTLAPLVVPSVNPDDTLGSPLAGTIFGRIWPHTTGLSDTRQKPDQYEAPSSSPLRLPTIDAVVGEAAAAEAAAIAAIAAIAARQQSPSSNVLDLAHRSSSGRLLSRATSASGPLPSGAMLAELQQRATAVELRLNQVQHLQQTLTSTLLQVCVVRLMRAVSLPLQQQQQAATWLAQQRGVQGIAAAATDDSVQQQQQQGEGYSHGHHGQKGPAAAAAAAGAAVTPAVAALAVAAAANAHVVAALLKALQVELSQQQQQQGCRTAAAAALWQQLSTYSLMLQVYTSVYRWSTATQRLVQETTPGGSHHAPPLNSSSSSWVLSITAAVLLSAMAAAVLYCHPLRHPGVVVSLMLGGLALLLLLQRFSAASKQGWVSAPIAAIHTDPDAAVRPLQQQSSRRQQLKKATADAVAGGSRVRPRDQEGGKQQLAELMEQEQQQLRRLLAEQQQQQQQQQDGADPMQQDQQLSLNGTAAAGLPQQQQQQQQDGPAQQAVGRTHGLEAAVQGASNTAAAARCEGPGGQQQQSQDVADAGIAATAAGIAAAAAVRRGPARTVSFSFLHQEGQLQEQTQYTAARPHSAAAAAVDDATEQQQQQQLQEPPLGRRSAPASLQQQTATAAAAEGRISSSASGGRNPSKELTAVEGAARASIGSADSPRSKEATTTEPQLTTAFAPSSSSSSSSITVSTLVAVLVAAAATVLSLSPVSPGPRVYDGSRAYTGASCTTAAGAYYMQPGQPEGPTSGGQALLGVALIATAVACLLQLLNRLNQATLQQQQQQEAKTPPGAADQPQSCTPRRKPEVKLSNMQEVPGSNPAPPKYLDPKSPLKQDLPKKAASSKSEQKKQPRSLQAAVAAAERAEAERAAAAGGSSRLTIKTLQKHTDSSSKHQQSPLAGSVASSKATSRSGKSKDTGLSSRDQDKQQVLPWPPQVSVQGRFCQPPTPTVTSWEVFEGPSVVIPPSSSKTSTPKAGRGGSSSRSGATTPKVSTPTVRATGGASKPLTPKGSTPKAETAAAAAAAAAAAKAVAGDTLSPKASAAAGAAGAVGSSIKAPTSPFAAVAAATAAVGSESSPAGQHKQQDASPFTATSAAAASASTAAPFAAAAAAAAAEGSSMTQPAASDLPKGVNFTLKSYPGVHRSGTPGDTLLLNTGLTCRTRMRQQGPPTATAAGGGVGVSGVGMEAGLLPVGAATPKALPLQEPLLAPWLLSPVWSQREGVDTQQYEGQLLVKVA